MPLYLFMQVATVREAGRCISAVLSEQRNKMDPCMLYYLLIYRQKQRRQRRWAVHPINRTRYIDGAFRNLFVKLREDPQKFFNYFRMSMTSFDELATKVRETITRQLELVQSLLFSPEEMLTITLRYLASGCTYTDLHYLFRVGITTASFTVPKTCRVLWITLKQEVFPQFSEEVWQQIAIRFESRANFPHCIGAIDGKHIRVIKPEHSVSLYYNYKNYFSVVLSAVADSDYKFIYIDVGSYGKDADSTIFERSTFGNALESGSLHIPPPTKINKDSNAVPYVFVADEAFGISTNVMRPFPGKCLNHRQKIFNYRMSRARRFVECSFGILTNKWRILHRPMNLSADNCIVIVKAACALHNFVRERDGFRFEDTLEIVGVHDTDNSENISLQRGKKQAYSVRQDLADYFVSPAGSVP